MLGFLVLLGQYVAEVEQSSSPEEETKLLIRGGISLHIQRGNTPPHLTIVIYVIVPV